MDFTKEPINQAEQAGEKLVDHSQNVFVAIIDVIFNRLWRTRVSASFTLDIGEKPQA